MRHEKVIKREDGKQVRIVVNIELFAHELFNVTVTIRDKGKKNWNHVYNSDERDYRKLDMDKRRECINQCELLHATPAEILEAKLELWEKIKPC